MCGLAELAVLPGVGPAAGVWPHWAAWVARSSMQLVNQKTSCAGQAAAVLGPGSAAGAHRVFEGPAVSSGAAVRPGALPLGHVGHLGLPGKPAARRHAHERHLRADTHCRGLSLHPQGCCPTHSHSGESPMR